MPGSSRWELPASVLCAALSFVPFARVPASFALLCLLPGVAFCRHRLGERSAVRFLILGSLLSLCVIPAVTIPAALLAGRPTVVMAVLLACAVTWAVSIRPVAARPTSPLPARVRLHLAAIAAGSVLMQGALSVMTYPSPDTIRWSGLPDLMFFNGIYTQLCLHTPPLDPENGASLLVHNWIYHFHFALVHLVSGLSIPAMQRLMSAWTALMLLGLVYLICLDVLRRPVAGLAACLLLMTSGEIEWLVRSAAQLSLVLRPLPWEQSPFGITLLFGWYNLPPLAAALGAWYWLERHRAGGRGSDLACSIAMSVALAFFHPIFYGVFMSGFSLWLAWLWLREKPHPAWLAYLLTPVPFFLFYKLPYYGFAMPPQVIHATLSPATLSAHAREILLSCGLYLALGTFGLLLAPAGTGPVVWIGLTSLALGIFMSAPNPHWFNDLLYVVLAIGSGAGLAWIAERWRHGARVAVTASVMVASIAFCLHVQAVLSSGHTFTPGEIAAGEWLRVQTGADDLVATLPNSKSSYTVLGLGQRRLVHGWTGHLLDFHPDARRQESEVREIFTTGDTERAVQLARRYRPAYLYLGTEELAARPTGLTSSCFPIVFTAEGAEIRKFTCAAALISKTSGIQSPGHSW